MAVVSGIAANAAEFPAPVLPAGVGVNIHFTRGCGRDLDLIAAAGFKFVRMDFLWSGIERTKGNYDWSAYDELTDDLDRRGIRAYYILDYSNPLYEEPATGRNPASPQHPGSVAAFARWAAASAKHFHGRHIIWEIWNEPNIQFWQPKPDVRQYITLALATCKAIREADPQATIIGPASSCFPWDFLETFVQSGVLEYLDGVSVHPYRDPHTAPETAAADYQKLRLLIERYAMPAKKDEIPILSSEWGYSTHTGGVSLETQADFAARQQLCNLLHHVPLSIWYDWKNDGGDPKENEHNFGTVNQDLTAKPAYTAIKTLTSELAGFGSAGRYKTASQDDYILIMTNAAGDTKLAVWTLGEPHPITLPLQGHPAKEIPLVSGKGQAGKVEINNGRFTLPLGGSPLYVTLGKAHLN